MPIWGIRNIIGLMFVGSNFLSPPSYFEFVPFVISHLEIYRKQKKILLCNIVPLCIVYIIYVIQCTCTVYCPLVIEAINPLQKYTVKLFLGVSWGVFIAKNASWHYIDFQYYINVPSQWQGMRKRWVNV